MNQEDIIRMAKEAGWTIGPATLSGLERFFHLAVAHEREKVARWMSERGYATGHGDTTEDLLKELDWQIAENWTRALINGVTGEREECAKVCDLALIQCQEAMNELDETEQIARCFLQGAMNQLVKLSKAIRARGEK